MPDKTVQHLLLAGPVEIDVAEPASMAATLPLPNLRFMVADLEGGGRSPPIWPPAQPLR